MTKELLDRFEAGVTRLISELEAVRVRNRQLETEADGLRIHAADRDRLEVRIAELEAQVTEAASAGTAAAEAVRAELETAKGQLEQATAAAARVADLESLLSTSGARVSELEAALHTAEAAIAAAHAEKAAAESTASEALAFATELEAAGKAAVAERDTARTEINALHEQVQHLTAHAADIERSRDDLQRGVQELSARLASHEEALQSLGSERDALAGELQPLRASATELAAERERNLELEIRIEELEKQLVARESEQVEVGDLRSRLEIALGREQQARERLSQLIRRIEDTEALLESVEIAANGNA